MTNYPMVEVSVMDSLLHVQRQILDCKLPKEYTHQGTQAPWGQMQILKLIQILYEQDQIPVEMKTEVVVLLTDTLEQSCTNQLSLGYQAIVFECIHTIIKVLPTCPDIAKEKRFRIVKRMLRYISALIKLDHNNFTYCAIISLELLIENLEDVALPLLTNVEHDFVFSCLNSNDESIRRKSFGLLHVLATEDNIRDICDKILSHTKEIEDEFYRRDLISRIMKLIEKFSNTSLDWRTFVLLRLLQMSKESSLRQAVMKIIQRLLNESSETNNDHESCQERKEVGTKLLKILFAPANGTDPPEALLELYLWSLAKFSDNITDAVRDIIKIVEKAKTNEKIVTCGLRHLFLLITKSMAEDSILFPKDDLITFLDSISHSSEKVQDQIYEIKTVLHMSQDISGNFPQSFENDIDCTLSFMDDFVLKSLEKGAPIYDPDKILVSTYPETKSPTLRFTPYNVMSESDWKSISSSALSPKSESNLSSGSSKAPEVWTLKGRVKPDPEVQDTGSINSSGSNSKDSTSTTKRNLDFEESVIQDIDQWK